jgi:hypothetical protein
MTGYTPVERKLGGFTDWVLDCTHDGSQKKFSGSG